MAAILSRPKYVNVVIMLFAVDIYDLLVSFYVALH